MMPDDRVPQHAQRPVAAAIVALAGVIGAAGIGIAAAAAHRGGGTPAATAGLFCLIHAGAAIALAGLAGTGGRAAGPFNAAAGIMLTGTVLFSGDLALAGLWDWRPVPIAAPVGGLALMAGWLLAGAAGLVTAARG